MTHPILNEILILLLVAVFVVTLFRRLNLPPVLAYLIVGMVVGPYGMGWMNDDQNTRMLAEFGVVFLLFTVGLEVSVPQMIAMRRAVLGIGGLQVLLTTFLAALLAWFLGMSVEAAFIIGGVLSLSSTAIVIKQLKERLELSSRHGRMTLGVLLFQDVAVIPFLIIIPVLMGTDESSVLEALMVASVKGVAVITIMLAVGYWLLRPLFHLIASSRTSELFTLTALLFALAAAWITHQSGLSLALGAFLGGMMLGETRYKHQVEADIRPFRDVLLGLFFVTIGMLLDIRQLPDIWSWVLLLVIGIIVIKGAITMGVAILMGAERGVAMRTGIVLAQGGEFGFVLLSLAFADGLLDEEVLQIVLAALVISMAISPFLIHYNGALAKRFFAGSYLKNREQIEKSLAVSAGDMEDHIIVCGYGRIGQNLACFIEQESFEYIAVDLDPLRVRDARSAGEQVNYGDSTHRKVLEATGLSRAKVLVITFDDVLSAIKILAHVRYLRPDLPVLVRTRDDSSMEKLISAGATEVVPETLESSLMMSVRLLGVLGVSDEQVMRKVQDVRSDQYQMLRGYFHGQDATMHQDQSSHGHLLAVTLDGKSKIVGQTLSDCAMAKMNVVVKAVRRNGVRGQYPEESMLLRQGDTLVLYGALEDLRQARKRLLSR